MKFFLSIFFVIAVSLANCTTLFVNLLEPTDELNNKYNSISEAYAAAVDGDHIAVSPGEYYDEISGSKSVTIRGTTSSSSKIISNTRSAFTITGGNPIIENMVIRTTGGDGITTTTNNPNVTIRSCTFESCVNGIKVTDNCTMDIRNCIFRSYDTTGITVSTGRDDWVYGLIANCIFLGSNNTGTGVCLSIGASVTFSRFYDFDICNSIFLNNEYGIRRNTGDVIYTGVIGYNLFYNNTTHVGNVNTGTGNFMGNFDPMLGNITGDPYYNFFPSQGSVCINNGHPNYNFRDPDGTCNDIGIFGGPHAWGGGRPVVVGIQVSPNPVQQGDVITIQATGQTK